MSGDKLTAEETAAVLKSLVGASIIAVTVKTGVQDGAQTSWDSYTITLSDGRQLSFDNDGFDTTLTITQNGATTVFEPSRADTFEEELGPTAEEEAAGVPASATQVLTEDEAQTFAKDAISRADGAANDDVQV